MTFQVRIQNLGKLADATVRVGGLTVLAGVNNTGKSFFSKALYSVLEAGNVRNPVLAAVNSKMSPVSFGMVGFEPLWYPGTSIEGTGGNISEIKSIVLSLQAALEDMASAAQRIEMTATQESIDLKEAADRVQIEHDRLAAIVVKWPEVNMREVKANIARLVKLGGMTVPKLMEMGSGVAFSENMCLNFLSPRVRGLKKDENFPLRVSIDGVGDFSTNGDEGIKFVAAPDGVSTLRKLSKVFFLDSPVLWRLRGILESAILESHNGRARADVPGYFRALLAALSKEYSGEMPFPEVYRRLTKEVIGGKIVRNDLRELHFAESEGGSYALSMTATGVVNLGILALLIERKILDKGAFLFIDEPESNLHPAWQVEMVRALFDLARGGVNVVMATHSADMMERLRALVAKYPESEEMIALNHFSPDGVNKGGDKNFRERMGDILEELTEEFAESYMGKVGLEEAE